jgi:hypothetical protein
VNFFKGNHPRIATAKLPWLWQAKGPACKGVPQGVPGGLSSSACLRAHVCLEREGPKDEGPW